MKNLPRIFFTLLIIIAALQCSFATSYTIDIALTSNQEVPSNPSTALGSLRGTYDDATNSLNFTLMFTGLVSPTTAAHFHGPATHGVNAAVVIGFAGFPVGVTSGSYSNTYTLTDPQETQLLTGQWYVNIHTNTYPGGEIRGQMKEAGSGSYDITVGGGQEVPSNPSTGIGNLTGTYNAATNTLSFNLAFTGLVSPTTQAHFHGPAAPGVNAPVLIGFAGFPVGVTSGSYSNTYVLTDPQETQLLAGEWYVNIHTSASPGGEIRGQLQEGTLPSATVVPLSIEWFRGSPQGDANMLSWKVSSSSPATLTLERSSDARNFAGIYTTNQTAQSNQPPSEFLDAQPVKGINYYRLHYRDDNGKTGFSNVIALINKSKKLEILDIDPNPVTGPSIKINITSAVAQKIKLVIMDVSGKAANNTMFNLVAGFNSYDVDVSRLAVGTYNVYGITTEGKTRVLTIMKQ